MYENLTFEPDFIFLYITTHLCTHFPASWHCVEVGTVEKICSKGWQKMFHGITKFDYLPYKCYLKNCHHRWLQL